MKYSPDVEAAIKRHAGEIDGFSRKRYGIGGEQLLRGLIKVESGGRKDVTSPAGAHGLTQFMPGTRAAVKAKYGIDPWRSADEAVSAAVLHLTGKVTGNPGLEGYNPGDPNYPSQVLAAAKGEKGSDYKGWVQQGTGTTTPGGSGGLEEALLAHLMSSRKTSLAHDIANYNFTTDAATSPSDSTPQATGQVKISPNANRAGADLSPDTLSFLERLSRGGAIDVGTGTNHNQNVAGSNRQSDHWDGHAVDIPATGSKGDSIAARALVEAGVDPKQARAMARKGGVFNVTDKYGKRVQVIWKTNTGGNHFNHVHIGRR